MKLGTTIVLSAVLLSTAFAMDRPSFHTKGSATGKPTGLAHASLTTSACKKTLRLCY